MSRLLCAAAVVFAALQPLGAASSPSPSPSLDGVLAAPPASDFVELSATTPGIFEGSFDAKGYVTINGTRDPTNDQRTLEHDGFVSGYGRTWVQRVTSHVLEEAVLAFNGADGAAKWMRQAEVADKALGSYKSSLSVDGVAAYYGLHLFDSASSTYSDGFVVLKGNDAFLVVFASPKDDLGTAASTQAKKQYDAAPDVTIPRSDWPQTASASSPAFLIGSLAGVILVVALIVGLVVFVIGRSRRRPQLAAAIPVAAAPPPAVQMSEDGHFWWDGQTWRDAANEIPPAAQRSSDGHFWWDGKTWRPVT